MGNMLLLARPIYLIYLLFPSNRRPHWPRLSTERMVASCYSCTHLWPIGRHYCLPLSAAAVSCACPPPPVGCPRSLRLAAPPPQEQLLPLLPQASQSCCG